MKKLILLVLILSGIALAYFEINDDVPGVFSPGGGQQWRLWAGHDSANILFDDSSGILFDDVNESIIVGKFTPGDASIGSTLVGYFAGTGFNQVHQSAFGTRAGYFNVEVDQSVFGWKAGYFNAGALHVAMGTEAGKHNDGFLNTAVGAKSFNAFVEDAGSSFVVTAVDPDNNTVTIGGGHGLFGVAQFRNFAMSTTGVLPAGLTTGPDVWTIPSATLLICVTDTFTDAGSGTITMTPQFVYTNSTALGYNAEPDASNQIMLGATNVTEVKTTGSINAGGGLTLGGNIIIPDDGLIGSVSDTDAIQIEADGDIVMSQDLAVT
ncbi:hypothetical protein LCGC14_2190660, partial [marine sediment metagenome]